MIWTSLIGPILSGIFGVIDKAVEDKDQAAAIKAKLQEMVLTGQMKEIEAAASIIVAEAKGESPAQRNWRPHLMYLIMGLLVFNGVVVPIAAAAGYPLPVLDAWNAIPSKMWDLLMIGIGGYVVGRSVEKGVEVWKR